MSRKEPVTKPGRRPSKAPPTPRQSGPSPRDKRKSEAPTLPPPPPKPSTKPGRDPTKTSYVRPRKRQESAATIDEVTADLSKDPRREKD
jgi:hypothetical protein